MYVLGETNLDQYRIHYNADGDILPEVPGDPKAEPEGSVGFILWKLRPMRSGDREMFESKPDDEDAATGDREGLIAMTASIEGLAVKNGDGEHVTISELTEENYDSVDVVIVGRAIKRWAVRMKMMKDSLGESEPPSDS